jgi:hypothetical protein
MKQNVRKVLVLEPGAVLITLSAMLPSESESESGDISKEERRTLSGYTNIRILQFETLPSRRTVRLYSLNGHFP